MLFAFKQGDPKSTMENLRKALSDAEGRNENINREFKKLLREKEVCWCFHSDLYSKLCKIFNPVQQFTDFNSSLTNESGYFILEL